MPGCVGFFCPWHVNFGLRWHHGLQRCTCAPRVSQLESQLKSELESLLQSPLDSQLESQLQAHVSARAELESATLWVAVLVPTKVNLHTGVAFLELA